MKNEKLECCVIQCDIPLDATYWNNQYHNNTTGWDLGMASPPIKAYIDSLVNKDIAILIPGSGNSYEVDYLLQQGFTNITIIDIAPLLVENLKKKYIGKTSVKIILGNFFEHNGQYDLIIEQTFFCALPPYFRQQYVFKMHSLLKKEGKIVGLLFNKEFEKAGPPFGGTQAEYQSLFDSAFLIHQLSTTDLSVKPRLDTELWFEFEKNEDYTLQMFTIAGFTCSSCAKELAMLLQQIENIHQVSISNNLKEVLVVNKGKGIALLNLQQKLAGKPEYKIY